MPGLGDNDGVKTPPAMKWNAAAALSHLVVTLLFAGALALLALSIMETVNSRWGGVALGVYLLSLPGLKARGVVTALTLSLLSIIPWGALLAVNILLALFLIRVWLGHTRIDRLAHLLAALLTVKTLLLSLLPGITSYLTPIEGSVTLCAALAVAATLAFSVGHKNQAHTDLILVAFLTPLLLVFQLTIAVLASAVAYSDAILIATLGAGVLLAMTALLAAPFSRKDGELSTVQHIFSLQVPIEHWLKRISRLSTDIPESDGFTRAAMREFLTLPKVSGVTWRIDDGPSETLGDEQRHHGHFHCPPLFIRLATNRRISPWEWFNYYLLGRMASEYCLAKQREERQRIDSLSRAVHETGARLTHDIKNILHTLSALTNSSNTDLIRRQMSVLRKRLETTLSKLQNPVSTSAAPQMNEAGDWWTAGRLRHKHQNVVFTGTVQGTTIPTTVFDAALDNFIANALFKRHHQPDLTITADFSQQDDGTVRLSVSDNGRAIPEETADQLFRHPVDSASGFGVGLYHVRLEAEKHGYRVRLSDNVEGRVRFCLEAPADKAKG